MSSCDHGHNSHTNGHSHGHGHHQCDSHEGHGDAKKEHHHHGGDDEEELVVHPPHSDDPSPRAVLVDQRGGDRHDHHHQHQHGHDHEKHHDHHAGTGCCAGAAKKFEEPRPAATTTVATCKEEEKEATTKSTTPSSSSCCGGGGGSHHGTTTCHANKEGCTTKSSACDHQHHHEHSHGHGHHHEHEHNHHHHHHPPSPTKGGGSGPPLCLAVIRENGTDLVVFDASGVPRTFRYEGDVRTLCFSDHGAPGADNLLTPCLDLHGNHHPVVGTGPSAVGNNDGDVEDEGCFCGIESPHLHAHVRHPDTCGTGIGATGSSHHSHKDDSNGGGISRLLATKVLMAVQDDAGRSTATDTSHDDNAEVLQFAVSDRMPKQCNARKVKEGLGDRGLDIDGVNRHRRRIHKVQHDDHVDYLVHDAKAGSLHLSYPCDDCGMDDVHGTFTNVATRRLPRRRNKSHSHHHDAHNEDDGVQLHFFQVDPSRPFSIVEHLQNLFQTHQSDRVSAATHLLGEASATAAAGPSPYPPSPTRLGPKGGGATVRSTFACTGICCSSETPVILKLLESVKGVHKVMVNVPVKHVLVDHDPSLITTSDLAARLTQHGFKATIITDGSASAAALASAAVHALTAENGRTVLFVEGICCASEVPTIKSILEPMKGVQQVSVNTTQKLVYINHSVAYASSQQLADALANEGFPSEIREDAARTVSSAQSAFVRSVLKLPTTTIGNGGEATATGVANEPTMETLTALLSAYDGTQVESFVVDMPAGTITVIHNPFVLSAQDVVKALHDGANIKADVMTDGADPKSWNIAAWDSGAASAGVDPLDADERRTFPRPNVIICGICWVISMLHYIGGNWEYLTYVGLLAVVIGIPPIAIKTYRTLRRYQFDTNALMFFASLGAVALQDYPEAAALVFLFSLSEWLEVRATTRARRALSAIVQLRPDKANLIHPFTKDLIVVAASSVPVGALVSVKPGDKVPCDGVVVDGTSSVDESSLTGESRPIRKGEGDEVSGGTVNSGLSTLMVRTTCTADNSAVARLIRLVEEAQVNRSETEKLVDEFAKFYTPVIVLAAIFMVSIPWAFGTEMGRLWTNNGLVLIVVACPCALIISTPVSYVAGLAATAQKGVLIKGGAHLEALGLVKRICFDKTGTLTQGSFALLHMQVTSGQISRETVWQYLTLMEERASHPLAYALIKAAANEKVSIPRDKILQKHAIVEGEGISGVVDGREVNVGNERMFARLGLLDSLSATDKELVESWKKSGGTVGFMSVEGLGVVCAFCVADSVRPEAIEVIQKLKKLGITTVMLTGDNRQAAVAIGQQVGLGEDDVMASLLPEDKLREVARYSGMATKVSVIRNPCSSRMLTMMVGDGVNDGPALATADVGVAMGQGAALAMETADVTLLDSNLLKLEFAMSMGRRVLAKIKQNIVFSLAVKLTVLGFALAGRTNLWAAIATDVGAMLLVTLNSMMLLPARQRGEDVQALKVDIENGTQAHQHDAHHPHDGTPSHHHDDHRHHHRDEDREHHRDHRHHHHDDSHAPAKSSCAKGCCGGASVVHASASGAGGHVPTNSTKGSCTGPLTVGKSDSMSSCKKGCCGGSPAPEIVKEDSGPSCKKGCCSSSGASLQEVPAESCKKGCCGSSSTLAPSDSDRAAGSDPKKGCCGGSTTPGVTETLTPSTACKKSCCCSSSKVTASVSDEAAASGPKKGCCSGSTSPGFTEEKATPSTACKKGCCGSSSKVTPSVSDEASALGPKKGCCSGSASHGITQEKATPPTDCKKGCCGAGGTTAPTDPDTHDNTESHGKGCCSGIVAKA